jgi:hypothetical protein
MVMSHNSKLITTQLIIYHNQSLLTETVARGNNQISDTNHCGGKLIHVSEVCVCVYVHKYMRVL